MFTKATKLVHHTKMLYWKKSTEFIYLFVQYHNKSSKLYEFKCYIGGHLFPVTL